MAWNDKDNQNPWGGNKQTPPELEEVIKDFKNKFNARFGGGSSGKGGVSKAARGSLKYFIILAVLLWLLSGIYIIDPAERGVVYDSEHFKPLLPKAHIGTFLTRLKQYIRLMWNGYGRQKLVSEISKIHLIVVL